MNNLMRLKIQIVDDDPFMCSTIRAILRAVDRSFLVKVAGDGETALRMIEENTPELVLCDVDMAPMSGLELVRRLRDHPNNAVRDTRVIMLTVHADIDTVHGAARLNINGYLVKPVSPKQLSDRLHSIFASRQSMQGPTHGA